VTSFCRPLTPRVGYIRYVSTQSSQANATADQYVAVFAALSEPLRVRIVHMIARHPDAELPNTMLDQELPVGKSTISYHVAILRRAGLISVRKAGRNYFYKVRTDVLDQYAPGFFDYLAESESLQISAA
jgi:DNA-binding transcriptional ArsR family regulator